MGTLAPAPRPRSVESEEVAVWLTRPVEELYPVLYLDVIRIKIRENSQVFNPGRLYRGRCGSGRGQARVGDLGPRHRGFGVLGARSRRPGQPGRQGCADRVQ